MTIMTHQNGAHISLRAINYRTNENYTILTNFILVFSLHRLLISHLATPRKHFNVVILYLLLERKIFKKESIRLLEVKSDKKLCKQIRNESISGYLYRKTSEFQETID